MSINSPRAGEDKSSRYNLSKLADPAQRSSTRASMVLGMGLG
jgi:hypothetical protein